MLFLWPFVLTLREVGVFRTWEIPTVGVGITLVVASLSVFGHALCMAYSEIDWHTIAQMSKDNTARAAGGKIFKKGDFILRDAGGGHAILNPYDFF